MCGDVQHTQIAVAGEPYGPIGQQTPRQYLVRDRIYPLTGEMSYNRPKTGKVYLQGVDVARPQEEGGCCRHGSEIRSTKRIVVFRGSPMTNAQQRRVITALQTGDPWMAPCLIHHNSSFVG